MKKLKNSYILFILQNVNFSFAFVGDPQIGSSSGNNSR